MHIVSTNINFSAVPPQAIVTFTIALDPPHQAPRIIDLHSPIYDWLNKNKHLLTDAAVARGSGQRKLLIP